MQPIVMRTIHTRMHHKDAGFNRCAFAGLEYHRTDGQLGRSASLQYFNVRLFLEPQGSISSVGDLEGELAVLAKFHVSIINFVLVYGKRRCPTAVSIAAGK